MLSTATTNDRHLSLPSTYGNSKLSYAVYRSARTDISHGNFQGWYQCECFYTECSLVWNFHMS